MSNADEDSLDSFVRRVARTREVDFPRQIAVGMHLAQRFDLECMLGSGGMGRVFRAFDHVRQTQVALKVVGRLSPGAILQLKREFRTAAGLVHPNVVRLHELFSDGAEWFFTMDWIDGSSLDDVCLEIGSPPFRSVFRQLGNALLALHRAGMIHSDLKPSNFLITRGDQRVVLIDFGLARPIGANTGARAEGTPRYMAPEQSLGGILTEAADWYAFGVVLRDALARRRRAVAAVSAVQVGEDLEELGRRLTRLNPRERPQAQDVLLFLGAGETHAESSRSSLEARMLVGREREVETLERAFARSFAGTPVRVLVDGPSGIGKTALLRHFEKLVQQRGGTVLASQCRERESVNYKAVDGLIDGLLTLLEDLPLEEAQALLPKTVSDLAILFPALRSAAALADLDPSVDVGDEYAVRARAIAAFTELLRRLQQHGPLLIIIDDLQWGDAESGLLLGPVLTGPHAVPLLFVAGCRTSADGSGPLIDTLSADAHWQRELVQIRLGPLEPQHARELALAYLPAHHSRAASIAHDIGRDAGGHPLFIAELAHSHTHPLLGRPSSSGTLFELISARVATLPHEARMLLETLAISGTPLTRGSLRRACSVDAAAAEAALDVLKAQRLARSLGFKQQDSVDIHHDRIRDIVLAGLGEPYRRELHLRLARVLDATDQKPEHIALHYAEAGEAALASRHWLIAADHAGRALAFDQAVLLYDRGLAAALIHPQQLLQIQVRRAHALANAGKGLLAAEAYLAAARGQAASEGIELQRLAAEQLILSGHLVRGFVAVEAVLRALGMRSPPGGRSALLALVWGRARLRARGLGYVLRSENELTREALTRLDAAWCIAASLGVLDPIRGASFQTRHLHLALETGEPRRLLRALALEAPYIASAGRKTEPRTRELLKTAARLAAATSDPSAAGLLGLVRGLTYYLQGRADEALTELELALGVLTKRCTGTVWETVTARRFAIASLFFLGRLRQLNEIVPPLLEDAEARGNLYATMSFRTAYAWAGALARDDIPAARLQLQRAREEWQATAFQLSHWNIIVGETYIDLYAGEMERACARAAEQREKVRSVGLDRIGVVHVQMWQLSGASAVGGAEIERRRGHTQRSKSLCALARRAVSQLQKNDIPRAESFWLLIQAALEALAGSRFAAIRCLQQSIDVFDAQRMSLFAAAARGRLGALIGGAEGRRLLAESRRVFESEDVSDPARMTNMLAPGFPDADTIEAAPS